MTVASLGVILGNRLTDELEAYIRAGLDVGVATTVVGSQDGLSDDDLRALDVGEPTSFPEALATAPPSTSTRRSWWSAPGVRPSGSAPTAPTWC